MKRVDTRARVFFVSHDHGRVDVTPDVVSVTTTKGMSGPGSWSLQLVPTRRRFVATDYLRDIRPDDWAEIYLTTDDSDGDQLVMWGPISQITRSRRASTTGVTSRINVNGTDWFKTLANYEASFDPILADIFEYPKLMQQLAGANTLGCFTAGHIVQLLFKGLTNFPPTAGQYSLPGEYGKRLFDFVQTANVNARVGGGLVLADVPTNMSGSLMNVLQYFSDTTNNYFYGDMFKSSGAPGIGLPPGWAPHLLMDRHPYDAKAFNDLPATVLPYLSAQNDTSGDNLGYHDHDIANWFRVRPQVLGDVHDDLALPAGPIINKESIRRHGIRRMNGDMPYSFPPGSSGIDENTQTSTIPKLVMESVLRIAQWYVFNESFLNGNMECRLIPKARVNTRLTYVDEYTKETYQFYVEQVSHQWSYSPAHSSTTLAVTRGYQDTPETADARQIAEARLMNASLTGQLPPGTLDIPPVPGDMA